MGKTYGGKRLGIADGEEEAVFEVDGDAGLSAGTPHDDIDYSHLLQHQEQEEERSRGEDHIVNLEEGGEFHGRTRTAVVSVKSFSEMLDDLRRDSTTTESLPACLKTRAPEHSPHELSPAEDDQQVRANGSHHGLLRAKRTAPRSPVDQVGRWCRKVERGPETGESLVDRSRSWNPCSERIEADHCCGSVCV
jgi:hypothetical protein